MSRARTADRRGIGHHAVVVVPGSSEQGDSSDADAAIRRLLEIGVAAYNADDFDAWRSIFASDFTATDHRPASLGSFDLDGFIAYLKELPAQVRTHHLVVGSLQTDGDVAIAHFYETAETLDGAEIAFESVFVGVVTDGTVRRWDIFPPEAEDAARALFGRLAT